jgi:hypothetical protein
MKIKENDFIIDGFKIGTYLSYTDVEPELKEMKFGDRVLPSPFFYEKNKWFSLIRQYAPGDSKFFPNGGFEVRDSNGGVRNYALDQVVLHPAIIKHQKTLDKMVRRVEKTVTKRGRKSHSGTTKIKSNPGTGRRGRPALSAEEKAVRLASQEVKTAASGGRRGRPKSTHIKPEITAKTTSNKRGRPPRTPTEIARKEADKATINARSKGLRGRPKSRS